MTSFSDTPIHTRVEDVPFRRTMSTNQWAATHSSRDKEHRSSHRHRKTKLRDSGRSRLARPQVNLREEHEGRGITRVAGVTSMLPNQQFSTTRESTMENDFTSSMSQGSSSFVAQPYVQHRERTASHTKVKPSISAPVKAEVLRVSRPLPSDDILNALFERLVERLHLSPEKVAELNMCTPDQKWNLILAQHELQAGIACVFYIEQLVRHAQPQLKEKHPRKKLLQNLQPLVKVLRDLEVDLRTNPNDSWVQEFVNTPNHGHVALIDLIKDLADSPYSVPRKNPRKYSVLDREPSYLYIALLCLKALMSHRQGFNAVLNYDPSLCVLAYCLNSESARTKVLILKLMVTVLLAPGGHKKVLQAFDYLRAIMKEKTRFQLLIALLSNEPVEPAFQAAGLCFINTIIQTAQAPNARVFHQHEFVEAGFDSEEIEKSLHGRQDERVLHELKEWSNNFISVQHLMDDLGVTRGRVRNLRDELEQAHQHLHEANLDRESLYDQTKNLIDKYEKQREKINTLNQHVSDLLEVKLERDDLLADNNQLQEANKRYHEHTDELQKKLEKMIEENQQLRGHESHIDELKQQVDSLHKFKMMIEGGTQTSDSMIHLSSITSPANGGLEGVDTPSMNPSIPAPPPLPPIMDPFGTIVPPAPPIPFGAPHIPPPPLIGGGFPGIPIKKAVIPNVPLPMLNWIPVRNPGQTIFKELNDEAIIETVDFTEFETLFQVKKFKKNEKSSKREQNLKKLAEQLCLIESRRARNLIIAKRRIGHTAVEIRDFVLQTDLDGLPSEYCELLVKFIPTEEELTEMAKNAHLYSNFGEAEQFIYQLAKIERYEQRLNCMTYMGNFDELLNSTQPLIDGVLSASLSIFRSSRLRKVFEVILAFGNYMNSSRRGAVYGFKLESLGKIMDTKSMDRKQTLLHYIVHVVEMVYPNVLSFYDDLNIDEARQVSMQLLSEDVTLLKSGLEDIEQEREREQNNFITFSFFNQAKNKVIHVKETFTKMQDAYREVCLMFDESPKQTDPSEFFGVFSKFVSDWKTAIHDNHTSKRRRMATTADLLRKEEDTQNTMANLAIEAVAEASVRFDHIREETKKLEEIIEHHTDTKRTQSTNGGVVQDKEAEAHDIRERGIQHINLKERLPWLNSALQDKEQVSQGHDHSLSPDTETVDQVRPDDSSPAHDLGPDDSSPAHDLGPDDSSPAHDLGPDDSSPAHDPESNAAENQHSDSALPTAGQFEFLQNGELDSELDQIFLPPKDYDVTVLAPKDYQTDSLPPTDYPRRDKSFDNHLSHENQLFTDNDYYSLMLNGL